MKNHILTVMLLSVMAIPSLPTDAHWSQKEPGRPFFASISPTDNQAAKPPVGEATAFDAYSYSSPVMFVENTGQWDENARFQVWGGPNGTIWLAENAIWITVLEPGETSRQVDKYPDSGIGLSPGDREAAAPGRGVKIRVSFIDANPHPSIEAFGRLDTTISYFYGNDPDQWRPDVPVWGGVRYGDLYPDIDLELTSVHGHLALRLETRAGADLSAVRLRVEGADAVELEDGFLRLTTSAGVIRWPLLSTSGSYVKARLQPRGGQAFELAAPFAGAASPVRAPTDTFDDPDDMLYGTFLGGSYGETARALAVDETGNVFVTGDTNSTDFPTTPGAFNTTGGDIFVAKLNQTGSALIYATYLGGSSMSKTIVIDDTGNAYVTGSTGSASFPVTPGAFDTTHGGGVCGAPYHPTVCGDAFVTKLNATGSALIYSTFLGNEVEDSGVDIAVDEQGNAYVINSNFTNNLNTTPDTYDICPSDSFLARLNPSGSALTYCTSLIGFPMTMAIDGCGSVYLAGAALFDDIPVTPGAFDTSFNGGSDGFVAKLNTSNNTIVYATYLGGAGDDGVTSIAVDNTGAMYIAGGTDSSDFPTTPAAFDTSFNGNYDGDIFVARLNPAGGALDYATYLGGSNGEFSSSVAVDGSGRTFVSGSTYSSDFPTTANAFDTSFNNPSIPYLYDVFLAGFNQTGSALIYSSYVGGNDADYNFSHGIALSETGSAYMVGTTYSDDFPTTVGAFDTERNSQDAFVVKLAWANRRYLPMMLVD